MLPGAPAAVAGAQRAPRACTEPGEEDRSDGKNGATGAGACQVVCDPRPRLAIVGGIVSDVQGGAAVVAA